MSMKKTKSKHGRRIARRKTTTILWSIFGGTLLILAAILLYSRQAKDPNFIPLVSGAPSLDVDKEQIDFGDVRLNEFVTASFELTNVGDKELRFIAQPYIEIKEGC